MSKQNRVFVLDNHRNPLMPCHPARARQLLKKSKAAVFRRFSCRHCGWDFASVLRDRAQGRWISIRLLKGGSAALLPMPRDRGIRAAPNSMKL
ncbi:RRXRR domain-containing protein [Alicyclobacillus shizuokensis]|uniref:RRXRR domain-containing protein n=1 Tax=Alicyclobacillus shizuokensis TaxID=392014 RepID=UPI0009FAE395|nr:RRXRR domain-containing protein [Alicyclobacillus shizuokensis]